MLRNLKEDVSIPVPAEVQITLCFRETAYFAEYFFKSGGFLDDIVIPDSYIRNG